MADRGTPRWLRWPDPTFRGLAFGADYNPEQWTRETWHEDVRAMRTAGVNIVSVAIFSWAQLQPAEDSWDFAWLDEVMDLLHTDGIAVSLATATASPPPWLTTKHPDILPVNNRGETVGPGARQHWRPASPRFREHALRLAGIMAKRYGMHPALAAWHVSNELGCHNAYDYSDDAARAFRVWLQERYQTPRGSQRRMGYRLLVAALQRLGADPAATARRVTPQPHPATGLQTVLLRRITSVPGR